MTSVQDRSAVVLLSGGLDSATVLAIALAEGFQCHALSFRYGQRHLEELEAAKRVAKQLGAADHRMVDLDMRAIGGSALTDDIDVPKDRDDIEMTTGIPVTYVPARNTIFLSYALGYAEVIESRAIFIGVNAVDYSGYPDCRPEFIQSFETTANLGTKMGVDGKSAIRIHAPLVNLTKAEIIRRGIELSVDYSLTRTCYDPDEKGSACRRCDACLLRLKGFEDNEMADPAPYQA